MKVLRVVRAKITRWRRLSDEQPKVAASAPAHVTVSLEG
jgi:hypothetical protein